MNRTRNIVITGGTDGIGLELVKIYAQQGNHLLVIGTRPRPGDFDAPEHKIDYLQLDVSASDANSKIVQKLDELGWHQLDIAILNAATARVSTPGTHMPEEIEKTFAINTIAPLKLAKALYPHLAQAKGTIAFVGSMAVRAKTPHYPVYTASKAALAGAARALYLEWRDRIDVCLIHPGPTATRMHEKAGMRQSKMGAFFTPPTAVANSIIKAIRFKKRVTHLGAPYMAYHALLARIPGANKHIGGGQ